MHEDLFLLVLSRFPRRRNSDVACHRLEYDSDAVC